MMFWLMVQVLLQTDDVFPPEAQAEAEQEVAVKLLNETVRHPEGILL